MARRQRSPVRVGKCFAWPFAAKPGERRHSPVCRWVCARAPKGAEFVDRNDRSRTAVLHPSTKKSGWQVSFFDADGAVSDVIRKDCDTALYDAGIIPVAWRLRSAVG
jgi:hypothetical protein